MKTINDLVAESVKRGIQLLNDEGPVDWYNHVSLFSLDQANSAYCLSAQLYRYDAMTDAVSYTDFDDFLLEYGISAEQAANCGMNAWNLSSLSELKKHATPWELLNIEWKSAIKMLRNEE